MSAPTNVVFPSPRLNAGERLAVSGYTRGQVADYGNARAAERDEIHAAPAQAVVLEALRMARDALDHYLHGGSTYRKPVVSAIAAIDDALSALVQPPEAPVAVEVSRLAARLVGGEAAQRERAIRMAADALSHAYVRALDAEDRVMYRSAGLMLDLLFSAPGRAAPTGAPGEQPHAGSVAEAFWNGTLSERNKP